LLPAHVRKRIRTHSQDSGVDLHRNRIARYRTASRSSTSGGEIDIYTAPRLRELLIDLVGKNNYQLIVNMDKVEFLDSTGLGVLVGGLKRVRAHDGSLDLVCTQERILKIFRITGLTKVFGIHETVNQAIAAKKGEHR
jgi:anti-sigma B factor antagonist